MTNESDDTRGVLKGYYEVNETGDSGVFKGKWKETGCHHMLEDVDRQDMDEVRPRHAPIKIDADRIDTRPHGHLAQAKATDGKAGRRHGRATR